MASAPIPAPDSGNAPSPGPGGGFVSPAPAQTDPGSAEAIKSIMTIVQNARMIGEKYPQTTSKVRQINDLVAQMIQDVKGSQGPTEPKAPPV